MEPTNDHERMIAQAVDEKFLEDPGSHSTVRDIATSLDFILMSPSGSQFLVLYVHWRRDHPISPSNSREDHSFALKCPSCKRSTLHNLGWLKGELERPRRDSFRLLGVSLPQTVNDRQLFRASRGFRQLGKFKEAHYPELGL
jgi:hypothetical protein